MNKFYRQPYNFSLLLKGEDHPSCALKESIAQRLHLILITNLNECRYNPDFGNIIWEIDFENIPNITAWKDNMSRAIREAVVKFELRLTNIKATLDVKEEEIVSKDKLLLKKIKKRVDIKITGNINLTNEQFYFQETLYVSPLWID